MPPFLHSSLIGAVGVTTLSYLDLCYWLTSKVDVDVDQPRSSSVAGLLVANTELMERSGIGCWVAVAIAAFNVPIQTPLCDALSK